MFGVLPCSVGGGGYATCDGGSKCHATDGGSGGSYSDKLLLPFKDALNVHVVLCFFSWLSMPSRPRN